MTKPNIHDMADKVSKLDLSLAPDFCFTGILAPQALTALGLLGFPCLRILYPGFALPVHASDTGSIIISSGKPSLTFLLHFHTETLYPILQYLL